ncbi:hypothetical protein SAMN04488515_1973 [Cognatiyoonia koreensis]|uniref:Uncharacterized protein n=1 Tax=Cognatiyoonia koreensis TaxID=364200 RepID=A0A1I0QJR7_9RHOB|nr:hypothetical protein [Cognatiyoonia koreensis]SEW27445.1 hypothetical protein SAMN04488515_1973 [Cognatiyoonia koreensis]
MRIILPVIFVLFAICGVFGLVLFNASQNGSGKSGGDNALSIALQLFSEDFVARNVPEQPVGELVAFLPEAPAGWTREGYVTAHGELITESVYQRSAVVISSTNTLLSSLERASRDTNGAAVTYTNGMEWIVVALSARSERDMRSLQGSIMTAISGNLAASTGFNSNEFASLHGVRFKQGGAYSRVMATNVNVPINYRDFTASMGGQLAISIVTNASDASVATIMRGIDIPGLNAQLLTPDLSVTPGTGLITRERGVLSTVPPEPSLPYKAFNRLRSGVEGLKEDDVRLLQAMADQKISGWVDVYDTYGLNHRLSDAVVEVLGEEPELPANLLVKYEAGAMLQNAAQFTAYERRILENLATGRVETQGAAQRSLESGRLYAPPIMRLIAKLPVEEETTSADGTTEVRQELVVRRGVEVQQGSPLVGECTIEFGVRRCVIEDVTQ